MWPDLLLSLGHGEAGIEGLWLSWLAFVASEVAGGGTESVVGTLPLTWHTSTSLGHFCWVALCCPRYFIWCSVNSFCLLGRSSSESETLLSSNNTDPTSLARKHLNWGVKEPRTRARELMGPGDAQSDNGLAGPGLTFLAAQGLSSSRWPSSANGIKGAAVTPPAGAQCLKMWLGSRARALLHRTWVWVWAVKKEKKDESP